MKITPRKNSFPPEVVFVMLEDNQWECWWCGQNHANCGHHIFGRGKQEGCEKSIFNFAPINNHYCHLPNHGALTNDEGKKIMLEKTIKKLSSIQYELKQIDNEFLNKYAKEINRLDIEI